MGTVKYNGPVASFHCPTEATIRSLKVHFSPKQLGEGTPSPENVREIEGWDGVEVQRCGENLFPAATYTRTASGITFTYYPNGDVHIEGTATTATWLNVPTSMYFTIFPGTYTISGNKNNSNVSIYLVVSKDNGGDIKFYTSDDIPSSKIINFTDNQARVQIAVSGGKTVNVTVHPRLEKGNYTEFETIEYEFGVLGKNKVPFLVDSKTISSQINGNAGWCNAWKIPNKNLKYTYSAYIDNTNNTNTANITVWLKNIDNTSYVDGTAKSGTQIAAGAVGRSTITLDASTLSNTYYFVFGITSFIKSGETASCTFSNPMVEIGDTATTYEPYNPNKTVYGGWVDLISGEVCEEWEYGDMGDLKWDGASSADSTYSRTSLYKDAYGDKDIPQLLTDSALVVTLPHFNQLIGSSGYYATINSLGRFYFMSPDIDGMSSAQIKKWMQGKKYYVYNTPTIYHIAPTQLTTFLSHNNIWSNADYVEVEYDLHETQNILARKQFITANQPHIVKPAAAPIQNFVTDMAAPLKECKIYFNPVQEGSGDPSPDNVRPISGWNGLELTRCGVNLLQCDTFSDATQHGYKFTGTRNSDGEIESIAISGTGTQANAFRNLNYIANQYKVPEGTFAFYGYTDDEAVIRPISTSKAFYNEAGQATNATPEWHTYTIDFNNAGGATWARIQVGRNAATEKTVNTVVKPMMCFPDNIGCEFEPYKGEKLSIVFPSEAGTVYGGYVDLVKGEVVTTYGIIDLGTLTYTHRPAFGDGAAFSTGISTISLQPKINWTGICNSYPYLGSYKNFTNVSRGVGFIYNNNIIIKDINITTNDASVMKAALNGVMLCYELAIPITYQLTSIQLKTLRGTNNIWSSANGDIEVKYWTH